MTEPRATPEEGAFVLYDSDAETLLTTQVFHSYGEAAEALDPRIKDVLILRLPLDDAEPPPDEDTADDHGGGLCDCQREGPFCSGIPGILARVIDGQVVAGTKVERCDVCRIYPSDQAALEKLRDLGMVGENYLDSFHCSDAPDGKHQADLASAKAADGAGRNRGTDWIIDFNCVYCGQFGSLRVDPADVQWA